MATRISIVLLVGIAVGSAATYYWIADRSQSGATPTSPDLAASAEERDSARHSPIESAAADATTTVSGRDGPAPASVAGRAAFYARVATADRATVEGLARTAAAQPNDSESRFVLDAALRRYLEIDAGQALSFARELSGANRAFDFLGPLFENWARIDRDAALAAVGRVDDRVESRAAAMAVLRTFGDEQGAIERVAAVVRGVDPSRFRVDAIGLRAASYPLTALREALAFADPATRKTAAETALTFCARTAPRDAMAIVESVHDAGLKSALRSIVLKNWAAGDVDGMLAYLPQADAATQKEILRELPMQIARANPERAIDLVEQMPLGQERQERLMFVAREYARTDPEKALAWARRRDPLEPEIVGVVFESLALSNPLRAFDLALTLEPSAVRTSALQSAVQYGGPSGSQYPALADKVLALDAGQAKDAMLETVLHNWGVDSVTAAADWLVANGNRVSLQTVLTLGQRFAQRDPDATAKYLDRVPSAARSTWIGAIAQTYARSSPQQAEQFLAQFRGDLGDQSSVALVAREIASYDPPAAARMLEGLDMTLPAPAPGIRLTRQQLDIQGAAMITAQQWARTDPAAAAAWTLGLPSYQARTPPLFAVSATWARTDPRGARAWILSLPTGADRDTALRGLVGSAPDPTVLDASLMNAFSTPEMGQRILSGFAGLFARKDPQAARRLMDEYVTDPAMRAEAERQIEFAVDRPSPGGLMPADPTLPTPAGNAFDARPSGPGVVSPPGGRGPGIRSAPH
jgi:hypothetical protein